MQKIMSFINLEILLILNCSLFLFTLLLIVANRVSIRKIRKNYKKLFNEVENGGIGQQLNKYFEVSSEIKEDYKKVGSRLSQIEDIVNLTIKKVGIIRYNAFENVGSDLSFSIALLNDLNDGIILSGLYSRDNSTTYAKPIKNGESTYTLSGEEKKALEVAKENYNSKLKKD